MVIGNFCQISSNLFPTNNFLSPMWNFWSHHHKPKYSSSSSFYLMMNDDNHPLLSLLIGLILHPTVCPNSLFPCSKAFVLTFDPLLTLVFSSPYQNLTPSPLFLAELILRVVTLHTRTIMGDSSASYIHLVHHLIEKCLIYRMTKEECVEALSKHAKIEPVVTSTVWNELEKENKEFFEAYAAQSSQGGGSGTGDGGGGGGMMDRTSEEETSKMIRKMISDQPDVSSASDEINQSKN